MSDVDRFVSEAEGERHHFTFRGETYELAPKLPALVVIKASRFRRLGADVDDAVSGDLMFDMLDEVFGADLLDRISMEHKLAVDDMAELLTEAVRSYGLGADDEGNREARRAVARGGRSTSPRTGRK